MKDETDAEAGEAGGKAEVGGGGGGSGGGGNGIEVYLRVRPSKRPSGFVSRDDVDEDKVIFNVPKKDVGEYVNNSRTVFGFSFSGVLDEACTQEDVFRTVGAPAVENALGGFNSTVFAYGQTGSGKTFTITGGPERYCDRGIIPRAISMLFSQFAARKADVAFTCSVSYLELYNECGYDLLAEEHSEGTRLEDMRKVSMMEDEDGNYHFRNLSVHPIATEEEALNCLFLGDTNRAIGETEMNQSSSRSHCIFTILVEGRRAGSDTVVRSKLNLVDLAGSERVHKTSSSGQTLREAQYINTSLFYLEMVIVALHEKTKRGKERTHVPYRNSMMTSVLRDSLGGNCKTAMVATISPEAGQTGESISTCGFAQRVALIKNSARVNEDLEPELVIRRLRAEVHRLREEVRFLRGESGEGESLTEEQRDDLARSVAEYVDDGDDRAELSVGRMTLTKIRGAFAVFRDLVRGAREEAGGGSGPAPPAAAPGGGAADASDAEAADAGDGREIAALRKTLAQRDREIAILVGMVKRGKDGGGAVPRDGGTSIPIPIPEQQQGGDAERPAGARARPPATVCGVERCSEGGILDEPSVAFEWFRDRYPGAAAIEENKAVLKGKYRDAKETGEVVQKCRGRINYHKATIEQLRRERAMEGIASDSADADADADAGGDEAEPHPEEVRHREAIEKHKAVYKDGFRRLRELKGTIEHIQCLMERGRSKMQSDFDIWYREMCGEPQQSVGSYMQMASEGKARHGGEKREQETYDTTNKGRRQPAAPEGNGFKLPAGVQLTGNKEADEDIIAFYKAKEALLARSKRP